LDAPLQLSKPSWPIKKKRRGAPRKPFKDCGPRQQHRRRKAAEMESSDHSNSSSRAAAAASSSSTWAITLRSFNSASANAMAAQSASSSSAAAAAAAAEAASSSADSDDYDAHFNCGDPVLLVHDDRFYFGCEQHMRTWALGSYTRAQHRAFWLEDCFRLEEDRYESSNRPDVARIKAALCQIAREHGGGSPPRDFVWLHGCKHSAQLHGFDPIEPHYWIYRVAFTDDGAAAASSSPALLAAPVEPPKKKQRTGASSPLSVVSVSTSSPASPPCLGAGPSDSPRRMSVEAAAEAMLSVQLANSSASAAAAASPHPHSSAAAAASPPRPISSAAAAASPHPIHSAAGAAAIQSSNSNSSAAVAELATLAAATAQQLNECKIDSETKIADLQADLRNAREQLEERKRETATAHDKTLEAWQSCMTDLHKLEQRLRESAVESATLEQKLKDLTEKHQVLLDEGNDKVVRIENELKRAVDERESANQALRHAREDLHDESCRLHNTFEAKTRAENALVDSQHEIDRLRKEKECTTCRDAQRSVIYLPCGHFHLCGDCDKRLHGEWGISIEESHFRCPVCRGEIVNRKKVFM
jgi:hypothetical protein